MTQFLEGIVGPEVVAEIATQCLRKYVVQTLGYDDEDPPIDDFYITLEPGETEICEMGDPSEGEGRVGGIRRKVAIHMEVQDNLGGVLRDNLENGSIGKDGTFLTKVEKLDTNGKPQVEEDDLRGVYFIKYLNEYNAKKHPRNDTKADPADRIYVNKGENVRKMPNGRERRRREFVSYPYTNSAHHLIPGNESLVASNLWPLMNMTGRERKIVRQSGKEKITETVNVKEAKFQVEEEKHSFKILDNIGYNVNGVHNGVWLPTHSAINEEATGGVKYGEMPGDWKLRYQQALAAHTQGMFHDRHIKYSDAVRKYILNAIAECVSLHVCNCEDCKTAGKEKGIPPPYSVIRALFRTSAWLRHKVAGAPAEWRKDYVTADTWTPSAAKKRNAKKRKTDEENTGSKDVPSQEVTASQCVEPSPPTFDAMKALAENRSQWQEEQERIRRAYAFVKKWVEFHGNEI